MKKVLGLNLATNGVTGQLPDEFFQKLKDLEGKCFMFKENCSTKLSLLLSGLISYLMHAGQLLSEFLEGSVLVHINIFLTCL